MQITAGSYRVVEELLQLLVCVVDAELFEAVEAKDLESGNVEDADEAGPLALGPVERPVDPVDDPLEEPLEGGLGDGLDGELDLLLGLGLGDVVPAHLDPGPEEGLDHLVDVDAEEVCHLLGHGVVGQDRLIRVSFLLERHVAEQEGGRDDFADGRDVLLGDAHDPHRLHREAELLCVVRTRDLLVPITQESVRFRVLQNEFLCKKKNKIIFLSKTFFKNSGNGINIYETSTCF